MLKWSIIPIQIYVLFYKLNKGNYSRCRKIIENKINEMYQYYKNENYNNEYPPATFYIESNIKRFINSISIFNLPKNIYDKKNNTEEEDSFQLNKRREQHE